MKIGNNCLTCHWQGDTVVEENGEKVMKPYCEKNKVVLPEYDFVPKQCLYYSMSTEWKEKYED